MSSSATAVAPKRLEGPEVSTSSKPFQSPRIHTLPVCLLLVLVVLVFYNPVTHNQFIRYDDDGYITSNAHVRAGLTWETVKWSFTTYQEANWHPLTWLSHALDTELFGLNPAGPHYVNVLLHATNVVLLFLLLQSATMFRWRSLMVAALFALHPINVESVAWAAERKNVLSTMLFLLALYAYGWYARRPCLYKSDLDKTGFDKAGLGRYTVVAGLFALALLCKPQVITFPFLLLLWDYWPLRRSAAPSVVNTTLRNETVPRLSIGWLVLEKLPLLLLSAASAVVTIKAQKAGGAIQTISQYGMLLRFETAAISYVRYLGLALWPSKLAALYPHPSKLYPAWQVGGAIVLLLGVSTLVLIPRPHECRYLSVGWFWFLGSLVPMIGLVQVGSQSIADRYAYISFMGLFIMALWLVGDWAEARHISARWLVVPAISCLLTLGTITCRQVGYWHDTQLLWQHTLAITQDNYVAEINLGEFLFSHDKLEEAAAHFRAAVAIFPDGLTANLNLGTYEDRRGNLPAAIERYQIVASHAGDAGMRATAYGSLGFVYRQMRESAKAKQCFETALQVAPGRTRAMVGLGLVAQDDGELAEAIRRYSLALSAQPSEVEYLLLAQALQRAGHLDEAGTIYQRLSRLSPDFAEAQKEADELLLRK
jgi:tetratricopeptide (TPR) repeat protein